MFLIQCLVWMHYCTNPLAQPKPKQFQSRWSSYLLHKFVGWNTATAIFFRDHVNCWSKLHLRWELQWLGTRTDASFLHCVILNFLLWSTQFLWMVQAVNKMRLILSNCESDLEFNATQLFSFKCCRRNMLFELYLFCFSLSVIRRSQHLFGTDCKLALCY